MTPELKKSILAFEDFLNEPPQYEDKRMVRDYRHAAYGRWSELRDKITAALSPPEPTEGQVADIIRNELRLVTASNGDPCQECGEMLDTTWKVKDGNINHIAKLIAALRAMPLQRARDGVMTREEAIQVVAGIYSKTSAPYTDRTLAEAEIDVLTALGVIKIDSPSDIEHWLKPGALIPFEASTLSALLHEVHRLRRMVAEEETKP